VMISWKEFVHSLDSIMGRWMSALQNKTKQVYHSHMVVEQWINLFFSYLQTVPFSLVILNFHPLLSHIFVVSKIISDFRARDLVTQPLSVSPPLLPVWQLRYYFRYCFRFATLVHPGQANRYHYQMRPLPF